MKRIDFKNKLAEEIHAGLKGFISYILGNADHLPNGSIVIKKEQVERWKRISNSTHYKLRTNEKVWANTIVERIMHAMLIFKKNATKPKADPRITEIKETFIQYCHDLKDFKPVIEHGRDGAIIKKRLLEHSKEDILNCFDWFLTNKDFENFSPSISTALSSGIFNKFLSQQ